jgi:hypothetical protein
VFEIVWRLDAVVAANRDDRMLALNCRRGCGRRALCLVETCGVETSGDASPAAAAGRKRRVDATVPRQQCSGIAAPPGR